MSPERHVALRALVTGWFSFLHGEATAGDLLAAQTVTAWLGEAGVEHETAFSPVLGGGPNLDQVDPAEFTHLFFVCGPAAGWQVEGLLERFSHCVKVAVGVSVLDGTPTDFDVIVSRDGIGRRPDLSLLASNPLPPVVGLVRTHPQGEYPDARPQRVHELIEEALAGCDASVVEIDTRVDPRQVSNRRPQDVEAIVKRMDAVVTTRMHGLVLALKQGVPAVAVDVVPTGAKVTAQAQTLAWPAILGTGELSVERVRGALAWALSPEARVRARESARLGRRSLESDVPPLVAEAMAHRGDDGPLRL